MKDLDPLTPMLKLALSSAKFDHEYFQSLAAEAKMPEVKLLLFVLAESESKMIEKIQHMMLTGVVDELEELSGIKDRDAVPDSTPIKPSKIDTDPRVFVCNKVLEKSIKTYMLYLRLATRAKSELVSRLFEYLAHLKMRQVVDLRSRCEAY
ncbi:MAG: hypothetical protein EAX95_13410 [Candidatus Thorarchaeota archaeon]|nr:hypothetical protein [Candidatus Thorarchaeota archaeon]